MLDVAISLALIFFLVATIVSGVHELIAAGMDLRGKQLERGIESLLTGVTSLSPNGPGLKQQLYAHPMLDALRDGSRLPSYIPASSYALALADTLVTHYKAAQPLFDGLPAAIDKMPDSALRRSLLALVAQSRGNAEQLRLHIEAHFDSVMDRVSGWYKRQTQWMMLVLGMVVAVALNIDSFELARRLANDAKLAQQMAEQASELVKQQQAELAHAAQAVASGASAPDMVDPLARIDRVKVQLTATQAQLDKLKDLRLPIGWSWQEWDKKTDAWWLACLGWLLTGIAASLGAPFWFDALSRFVAIRGSGKPVSGSAPAPGPAPVPPTLPAPPTTANAAPPVPALPSGPTGPLNDFESTVLTDVDILALQLALGLTVSEASGELNPVTREALRRWQRQQGLLASGEFDEPTAMAILYP